MRIEKTSLSFEQYCLQIEDLLKLMGRKIKARPKIEASTFIL